MFRFLIVLAAIASFTISAFGFQGILDTSFGSKAMITQDLSSGRSQAEAVAVQQVRIKKIKDNVLGLRLILKKQE